MNIVCMALSRVLAYKGDIFEITKSHDFHHHFVHVIMGRSISIL